MHVLGLLSPREGAVLNTTKFSAEDSSEDCTVLYYYSSAIEGQECVWP